MRWRGIYWQGWEGALHRAISVALVLFAFPCFSAAHLNEVDSLAEVDLFLKTQSLQDPVLIAMDIHGTLAEARQFCGIGSDPWVRDMIALGLDFQKICAAWGEIQRHVALSLIEKQAVPYIEAWRRHHDVIAITGGLVELSNRYPIQLRELSFSFDQRALRFLAPTKKQPEDRVSVTFQSGILAVGPLVSKGEALRNLIMELRITPKTIVFVDNETRFLNEMVSSLGNDYEFYGFKLPESPWTGTYDSRRARQGLAEFIAAYGEFAPACAGIVAAFSN